MEGSEEEDTSAGICRRVVLRKYKGRRRPGSLSANNSWIDNSFKNGSNSKTEETLGSEELLNTSDLMMAQIDIDEMAGSVKSCLSSPLHKKQCSANVQGLSDPNKPGTVSSNSLLCDLSDDEDLFKDNDLDYIFFSQLQSESYSKQCLETEKRQCVFKLEPYDKICETSGVDHNHKQKQIHNRLENTNIDKLYNDLFEDICKENSHDSNIEKKSSPLTEVNRNTRQSLSLKDRLKQRLLNNVGATSPLGQSAESKLKEEALRRARVDASQIRKEGTKVDIGPFYGLPSKVKDLFEKVKGISKLYDWQDECLKLPAIKDKKNLIYTLPTSGGKTLVAEILILREIMCYQKDALLILPFVSIVQEKVRGISEFASDLGFLVEEYAGSKGRFPPIKRRTKKSLYIATIEKGHSLVNSLIETGRLDSLGLVVVDELHMLGEGGSRGATLESTLLKILHSKAETQIIGMSATLNNITDILTFLQAELYSNNFRPVSLQEFVKIEDNLFSVDNKALSKDERLQHDRVTIYPHAGDIVKRDPDQLLGLVNEVIPDNSCLVFCSTKKNCENVALMLSELMCKHQRNLMEPNKTKRRELLQELHRCGNAKICPTLSYTIHFGIAYHHSGLTMDERRLIEEAYSQGTLCLLTCTSTLAAGVNLPAKRVILRSPYVGMEFIKYSQYKQMTGRAGRAGLDSSGESILIAKKHERLLVKELLSGPKDFCHSSLMHDEGRGIQSLLLSAIGLKIVTTTESAFQFLENSLLSIQSTTLGVQMEEVCKEALQYLIDQGLVAQGLKGSGGPLCLDVTSLGKATFKGSVNHLYSPQLYQDLSMGETSLVLSNHFHLLYLVTPYDLAGLITPAWDFYYKRYCQLSETETRVANLIGISENFLSRKSIGLTSKQKINLVVVNRFYLALMLWDLWNQQSIWDVAQRFSISRGFVQNLLNGAASFASCVSHFCQELEEFWPYQDLLGNLVKRLSYCVTSELIPLMEVPGVLLARAKQLYSAGICSLAALAKADAEDLATQIEHLSKRNARQIISSAKNLVEEKTAILMEEVESLVTVTGTNSS